ncbi:hypothetical protein FIV42_04910 [Persicimonas caeni]|uniref:Uncharacterized protein n=1 Tax=Persicimonas caeni TaxID=2292766 RepID=A0A4Y6PQ14_PERCE|nr:hypothetical protein [Persicimonas caeni]QDG50097.1 hypothetical protein FIV42_04910 [Persicimonas caeni]QED31318.1 hypothetical protein FRD00_04905 [Persicimonas caeni]
MTTLADARERELTSAAVIEALSTSRVVSTLLDCEGVTAETLPWPEISRQFEVQLEVLWRQYQSSAYQSDEAEREAIRGAFDRIAAELYGLTIDDLMLLQRSSSPCTDSI